MEKPRGASAVEVILNVLTVLLWFIGGIAAVILFALCTPIRVVGFGIWIKRQRNHGSEPRRNHVALSHRLAAGPRPGDGGRKHVGTAPTMRLRVIGIPIRLDRTGRRRKSFGVGKGQPARERKGRGAVERHRKAKARSGPKTSWADVKGLLPEIRWCIAQLWRVPRFEAQGDIVYGFADPAMTGWCEALKAIRPLPPQLKLTPDFTEARLEGWLHVRMSIYPVQAVVVMIRTLLRRGVRRIWWSRMKSRFSRVH